MSSELRLTIVAGEFPYPVTHGGRADIWRRIEGLARQGVALQLICWYSPNWGGAPSPEHIAAVEAVVDELVVLPIPFGPRALLRRLLALLRWPSHAAARAPTPGQWRHVLPLVEHFRPTGIWQDNLWGAVLAQRLAATLGVPHWIRSHNIEHRYVDRQAALARGWSERLRVGLATLGLKRFEFSCLSTADAVFDISQDDMAWWQAQGLDNLHWLPPLVQVPQARPAQPDLPSCGVLFVGNLHTPNNVEGVLWFLQQVWPRVLARRPQAMATLAGARPHPDVLQAAQATQHVQVVPDPADVWTWYDRSAVLINPALAGSGVAIKTVEMLHVGRPLVSTPVGAAGLPSDVRRLCQVAETAEAFANLVVAGLDGALPQVKRSDPALSCFTEAQLAPLADNLVSLRAQWDTRPGHRAG